MKSGIVLTNIVWFSLFIGIYSKSTFIAHFNDDVFGCEHFTNEYLECSDLKVTETTTPEGYNAFGLSGPMELIKTFDSEHDIYIEIWKVLPFDKELMWSTRVKLCDNLKKKDAPWYCLVEAMNITDCPLHGGKTFNLKDILISLDFLKGILNYELCGIYSVIMKILNDDETVVCYNFEVSIEEED